MTPAEQSGKVHHGHNTNRFRELNQLKQDAFARALGDEWSQKKVSRLEEQEVVEDDVLEQVAVVLRGPIETINHFTEDAAVSCFNTFHDNSANGNSSAYFIPNSSFYINTGDDLSKLVEENKKNTNDY